MTLEDKVRAELLAIRKTSAGMCVATLSEHPVTCALMGNGDPAVTLNAIKHALLRSKDDSTSLSAALSSLGLSSGAKTHLGRLEEFGQEFGYEQRQVRRYSDQGVRQLARMIAKNWSTTSVPHLDATVIRTGSQTVAVYVHTEQQIYIEMRPLRISLNTGHGPKPVKLGFEERTKGIWRSRNSAGAVDVALEDEASLRLVWIGETWPKFSCKVIGEFNDLIVVVEAVGNTMLVRLVPPKAGVS